MSAEKDRLEYLRGELRAERISTGELIELQNLVDFIDPSDMELLEAAGVPEFTEAEFVDKLVHGQDRAQSDEEVAQIKARAFDRIAATLGSVLDWNGDQLQDISVFVNQAQILTGGPSVSDQDETTLQIWTDRARELRIL